MRTRKLSRMEGLPQAARPAAEFCSRRSLCSLTVSVHLGLPRRRLCPGDAAFVPPLCGGFPHSLCAPARGFPTHGSPKGPHGSPYSPMASHTMSTFSSTSANIRLSGSAVKYGGSLNKKKTETDPKPEMYFRRPLQPERV